MTYFNYILWSVKYQFCKYGLFKLYMRRQKWRQISLTPLLLHFLFSFQLPNEIFLLGLSHGALAVCSYPLCCENRSTCQCWPSCKTIGRAVRRHSGGFDGSYGKEKFLPDPMQPAYGVLWFDLVM